MADENKKFWWEKTIEYLFVMKHINVEDLVVPLDGNHEVSGDAIIGRVSKWVLIEFKCDESSLASEVRKYGGQEGYEKARDKLLLDSNHHFLVYGALIKNKLNLQAKGYFNLQEISVESAVQSGKSTREFTEYLKELNKLKKKTKKSESSSGGSSINYDRVIGVSDNGDVSECMTIKEYANRYSNDLELKRKAKLEQERQKALEDEQANTLSHTPKPR